MRNEPQSLATPSGGTFAVYRHSIGSSRNERSGNKEEPLLGLFPGRAPFILFPLAVGGCFRHGVSLPPFLCHLCRSLYLGAAKFQFLADDLTAHGPCNRVFFGRNLVASRHSPWQKWTHRRVSGWALIIFGVLVVASGASFQVATWEGNCQLWRLLHTAVGSLWLGFSLVHFFAWKGLTRAKSASGQNAAFPPEAKALSQVRRRR